MTIAMTITNLASPTTAINAADVTSPDAELLGHLNNLANAIQASEQHLFKEITLPATPASTYWKLYFKSTGLYILDDTGAESLVAAGTISYTLTLSDILKTQVFS